MRIWLLSVLFLLTVGTLSGQATELQTSFSNHDYKTALSQLLQIDSSVRTADEWHEIAMSYSRLGDSKRARNNWRICVSNYPENSKALYYLGLLEYTTGETEKALFYFNELHKQYPENSHYTRQLAKMYQDIQADTLALHYYLHAVAQYPEDIESILAIAKIYNQQKNYQLSDQWIQNGLKEDKQDKRFLQLQIENCYSEGFYSATLAYLELYAEALDWNNYWRRLTYISLIHIGKYDDALEVINTIEEPDKNKENTFFYRYKAHMGLGDKTQARLWLERTIMESKNKQEAVYQGLLGNLFIELEMYPQAARHYQFAYSLNEDKMLLYWIARAYDAGEKYRDALLYYDLFLNESDTGQVEEMVLFSKNRREVLKSWAK
jgi:tetratricopeptide (TPR) repeat protein